MPSGLVGTIYSQLNLSFMETPYFEKKMAEFFCVQVDWPHLAQVRFWRPKRPHLEEKKPCRFGNLMGQLRTFQKASISRFFLLLWVARGRAAVWVKTVFSGVLDQV